LGHHDAIVPGLRADRKNIGKHEGKNDVLPSSTLGPTRSAT
jgi:hypothetical protein